MRRRVKFVIERKTFSRPLDTNKQAIQTAECNEQQHSKGKILQPVRDSHDKTIDKAITLCPCL